ncbi:GrpB family protein, partial [Candidatus Bathyarchaeota archaeon]
MSVVEVVPYNPEWRRWFEELREPIWALIHEYVVDVVHVGSTSIEGMSAKPIIDMDILVDDLNNFGEIKKRLATLGYTHVGDLGISGREAFNLDFPAKYPHHLYLCHIDSVPYRNHRLL